MHSASQGFGWYLAVLQLFFTLTWAVYAALPQMAAAAMAVARLRNQSAQ
jgi:hypothetical protein